MEPWIIWLIFSLLIVFMFLSFFVQSKFKKTIAHYSTISSSLGKTGAEVAKAILEKNNITDVKIIRGETKQYADNFNPKTKVITLSSTIYDSTSIAAVSVAAHEVGHAIQFSKQTVLIKIRATLVAPVMVIQKIGSVIMNIGMMFLLMSLFVGGNFTLISSLILGSGLLMTGATAVFSLVTLPVEYDASRRAKANLLELDILSDKSSVEYEGVDKVLKAAANTYLVALLVSFTMFLYYLAIILSRRN